VRDKRIRLRRAVCGLARVSRGPHRNVDISCNFSYRQSCNTESLMGPNLLMDKSALQMLSQDELYRLSAHFNLITCDVLLIEILGDLKKWKDDEALSTVEVQRLAKKLVSARHCAPHTYNIYPWATCLATMFR
jgi:hypothetical protein